MLKTILRGRSMPLPCTGRLPSQLLLSSAGRRLVSSSGSRGGGGSRSRRPSRYSFNSKKKAEGKVSKSDIPNTTNTNSTTTAAKPSKPTKISSTNNSMTTESRALRLLKLPYSLLTNLQSRFRMSGAKYTSEHATAVAQRLSLAMALVAMFMWDQTSPFSWIILKGPSMLPTMASDGSEVWLTFSNWFIHVWRLGGVFHDSKSIYRKGDLVGFSPPENKNESVSCKRIIGTAGDTIASNGEYVHLFVKQDPVNLGKSWPKSSHSLYSAVEQRRQLALDAKHTEVVPENHVWLEADNPGMGVDSRQFGPIPEQWIRGAVVARFWPLESLSWPKQTRPHPIALDEQTLAKHNVHRVKQVQPEVSPKEIEQSLLKEEENEER